MRPMCKKDVITVIIAVFIIFSSGLASAGIAVIMNSLHSGVTLNNKQVAQLYLRRKTSLPNGVFVIPLDQVSDVRDEFYRKLTGRTITQMKSYWSRLIYTNSASPPDSIASNNEVLELVAQNPNLIGYVDANTNNLDRVAVVFEIP